MLPTQRTAKGDLNIFPLRFRDQKGFGEACLSATKTMPECELCGETHATVNGAEWCDQTVMACPGCWASFRDSEKAEIELELDREVAEILEREDIDDIIVNGLIELERAKQMAGNHD